MQLQSILSGKTQDRLTSTFNEDIQEFIHLLTPRHLLLKINQRRTEKLECSYFLSEKLLEAASQIFELSLVSCFYLVVVK